ncbi:hypothetical protein, partial [Pseudomonas protegens]|uniref:hypothetical protein n=1 Tax=Pseudomonas protegens TaxID=380021 RepID=UPI001B3289A5|nr:hypothetical protein [Pseudomonas protegens]
SQYFGAEGQTLEQRDNLSSDLFFSWLNTPQAALVVGTDVRHTKAGAANLGAGLLGLRQGMGATAEA